MSVKAKKYLGQHFLKDENIAKKIADTLSLKGYDDVLEIGPGMGVLTKYLLDKDTKTHVVEIDTESVDYLKNNYLNLSERIYEKDFLRYDFNLVFKGKSFAIIGNFPYNISTQIVFKTLEMRDQIPEFAGMFQKEVADRIIAKFNTSTYGRLSILSNWKLSIKKICDIKPESFSPRPKIDSSLLFFSPKKNFYKIDDPKNLEKITRVFFNHRRKMLKKPFNQLFNGDQRVLDKLKIDLNLRPQNLDFDTYYQLTSEYENLRS